MVPACQTTLQRCAACPHLSNVSYRQPSSMRSLRRSSGALRLCCRHSILARAGQHPGGSDDMSSAFAREMASRTEAQEKALEQGEASTFGGRQLLEALQDRLAHMQSVCRTAGLYGCADHNAQCRYGRSYDVSLVQRKYLGKVIIAFNIMWKYREQVSFGVSSMLL